MWAQACELIDAGRAHAPAVLPPGRRRARARRRGSRRSTCSRTSARSSIVVAHAGRARPSASQVTHEPGVLVVRGDAAAAVRGLAPRACASSRFRTASSSGASRCRRATSRSARRELDRTAAWCCACARLADEHDERTTHPIPDALAAEARRAIAATADAAQPQRERHVASAARGRADHPAGAQRRAVPRRRCCRSTVGRERSRAAAQEAVRLQRPLGVLLQSKPEVDEPGPTTCTGSARPRTCCATSRRPTASHHVDRAGRAALSRAAVPRRLSVPGRARRSCIDEPEHGRRRDRRRARCTLKQRARRDPAAAAAGARGDGRRRCRASKAPAQLADFIAGLMDISAEEKQALLETFDLQGAARQAARAARAPHRGAQALARDRRAHASESIDDASASTCCASRCARSRRSSARATRARPRSRSSRRRSPKRGMPEEVEKQARKELKRLERMPEARRRVLDGAHLPRVADRAAVDRPSRSADRHRRGAPHPRRGPLRSREDQAAHPRVPRGAQAQSRRARARSCASSARPAWARPRSARASRGRPGASSCA